MPANGGDSSSVVGCHLSPCPQAARAARRLTRDTFRDWGLVPLADDAETIVGELVANAVTYAAPSAAGHGPARGGISLHLMRRTSEVVCAVLDPSYAAPVLKSPGGAEEAGRGLHMVDIVSDVWGWSPVAGRGKAVWAILFCS
jgi:anti-sigma regulatory factor (Ser/Thr protein kinase)